MVHFAITSGRPPTFKTNLWRLDPLCTEKQLGWLRYKQFPCESLGNTSQAVTPVCTSRNKWAHVTTTIVIILSLSLSLPLLCRPGQTEQVCHFSQLLKTTVHSPGASYGVILDSISTNPVTQFQKFKDPHSSQSLNSFYNHPASQIFSFLYFLFFFLLT